jgi:hypothetical protein
MKPEKRKNSRVTLSVPIRYKVFQLDNLEKDVREEVLTLRASIQDLSAGGIRVVSEKPFRPGDIIELEMEIPGDRVVRSVAKVAWSEPAPKGKGPEHYAGIQFIPVYEEDLAKLKDYLRSGG